VTLLLVVQVKLNTLSLNCKLICHSSRLKVHHFTC